jgi:hypothetical protein
MIAAHDGSAILAAMIDGLADTPEPPYCSSL